MDGWEDDMKWELVDPDEKRPVSVHEVAGRLMIAEEPLPKDVWAYTKLAVLAEYDRDNPVSASVDEDKEEIYLTYSDGLSYVVTFDEWREHADEFERAVIARSRRDDPVLDLRIGIERGEFFDAVKTGWEYEEYDFYIGWDRFEDALARAYGIKDRKALTGFTEILSDVLVADGTRTEEEVASTIVDLLDLAKAVFDAA